MPDELSLDLLVAKLFIERRDVKAIQKSTGEYNPLKQKWTRQDIQTHLEGKQTYGHYQIDPASQHCRVMCFDLDLKDQYREIFLSDDEERINWLNAELRCFAQSFEDRIKTLLDIPTAQLFSGNKGVHVYGFTGSTLAATVRKAALAVMKSFKRPDNGEPEYEGRGDCFFTHYSYPELEIEVFPKQDEVENGHFGNLIRLPLGVNKKSGRKSFFYDTSAPLWEFVPVDPLGVLNAAARSLES